MEMLDGNRTKRKETLKWLKGRGVVYELVEHQAAFTVTDVSGVIALGKGEVCKNLFLRDHKGKRHFLVCMPCFKRADLKALGAALGVPLSFASQERLLKYLNLTKGSVTPLGVMYDSGREVEVILDSELEACPKIGVHPCDNTATVFIDFKDLVRVIKDSGNELSIIELK